MNIGRNQEAKIRIERENEKVSIEVIFYLEVSIISVICKTTSKLWHFYALLTVLRFCRSDGGSKEVQVERRPDRGMTVT